LEESSYHQQGRVKAPPIPPFLQKLEDSVGFSLHPFFDEIIQSSFDSLFPPFSPDNPMAETASHKVVYLFSMTETGSNWDPNMAETASTMAETASNTKQKGNLSLRLGGRLK